MSLETLIELAQYHQRQKDKGDEIGDVYLQTAASDALYQTRREIADFVLKHADTFIAWERQHVLRISPFDEEGAL